MEKSIMTDKEIEYNILHRAYNKKEGLDNKDSNYGTILYHIDGHLQYKLGLYLGMFSCMYKDEVYQWFQEHSQDYEISNIRFNFYNKNNMTKPIKHVKRHNTKTVDKPVIRNQTSISSSSPEVKHHYGIISIMFANYGKTYDYFLINKSKQRLSPEQQLTLITGSHNNKTITLKHLKFCDQVPTHVTKSLIVTTPTTAIIGLIPKGGK